MGVHHLAFASRDTAATHRFYTESTGFELVKVEKGPTPEGGWSKHFFYEMGDGSMIAFWEIHDQAGPMEPETAISTGLDLPIWVNHVAFVAPDRAALGAARERWVEHGQDVLEVDHEWCVSIYTEDPNGIMVEFCLTTRPFSAAERSEAATLLFSQDPPEPGAPPKTRVFHARDSSAS